jgi:hypothetical protein
VIAGDSNIFKIQAKDAFSNIAVKPDEIFAFEIKNTLT